MENTNSNKTTITNGQGIQSSLIQKLHRVITNLFAASTDHDSTAQSRRFGGIHAQGVYFLEGHHLLDQGHVGLAQHLGQLLGDSVTILFQESVHVIFDRVREMFDEEA